MRKLILIIALLDQAVNMLAKDGDYAVSKIPAELMKNANVVKRIDEETFDLKNAGEAVYTHHYVLTILNENGDKYGELAEPYNKFIEIRSIDGALYDANGKALKRLKTKDVSDLSGRGDENLIDDTRYKLFQFYYKVYPYTVEYTVEVKYYETMFYPYWQPCEYEKMAIEESRFIFSCAADYELRYKSFNCANPEIQNKGDRKMYTWEAKLLPAVTEETFSPRLKEITPYVNFGPTDFQMQGYKGSMRSWHEFGKFMADLKQGRDLLPDDVKGKVHQLTDGISDRKEKIRVLYEFLQANTRYISIQLGIGSWQPFDAKYVSTKGFGDCKALSNYMYSLLKEAGIKSYYTLIRAGENAEDLIPDFPCARFNHVILFAPVGKDTVWLECTSQSLPAGYLSSFTSDRYALAIDDGGGTLVRTPKYGLSENVQARKISAKLQDDGTLTGTIVTNYSGLQQDAVHELINNLSKDKVKEILNDYLDLGTYDINKFDYKQTKGWKPSIEETLDISVSNYATVTGRRLFIIPNVMDRSNRKLKSDETRKYDIELFAEDKDLDSVEIELPKGYEPESMPQPVTIESKFGKYSSNEKLIDNKIIYYRSREEYRGTFRAKDYPDLVNYYDAIYKADRNKIVLVKKEGQ